MGFISIDISEVTAIATRLNRKAKGVELAVSRIVAKSGYDIQATAQRLAPVDTGTLRSSIGRDFDADYLGVTVTPTVEYAPYVEEGTSTQAPQPFMGPAFDQHAPKFEAAVALYGSTL